jgi:type I restriction enzyme S subunit
MTSQWPRAAFGDFLVPNSRPYTLGAEEDANLVGMRLYGAGPFHRELKSAMKIAKKTHFVINAGDIIYNKLFAWKGTFGVVPEELNGMFVSDKFPTYQLDRSKIEEDWLRWYFRCPPLWEEARKMSTGSAALSKLTLNPPKFLLLTIPLPDRDVQRRIVAKLNHLAAQIKEARALQDEARKESPALLQSALRELAMGFSSLGRLEEVLNGKPRNGWSASCDNIETGIPVLSLAAVTGFRFRSSEFKRTSLHADENGHFWLKPGDLLITRSNTPELVGHAAIYNGRPEPCIYPDLMMRIPLRLDKVDLRFAWYWLQSPPVREFISKNAKGTSPTMKKISQGTVMALPFPTAVPMDEQRKIVANLDTVQREVDRLRNLQSEISTELDALLPSVLSSAFSGGLIDVVG